MRRRRKLAPLNPEQQKLFDAYAGYAKRFAQRWAHRRGHSSDAARFENAALIGLWHTCVRFEPQRGLNFLTLMYHRVFGEIVDEQRRADPVSRWTRLKKERAPHTISIDEPLRKSKRFKGNRDDDISGHSRLIAPNGDPTHELTINDDVRKALQSLPNRQMRIVVRMYYWQGITLDAIGKRMHLTQSRIAQIHHEALECMRRVMVRED